MPCARKGAPPDAAQSDQLTLQSSTREPAQSTGAAAPLPKGKKRNSNQTKRKNELRTTGGSSQPSAMDAKHLRPHSVAKFSRDRVQQQKQFETTTSDSEACYLEGSQLEVLLKKQLQLVSHASLH
jgi:hypothetical protein